MPLPHKFDENEWFVIIGIIISYTIFFLLPKRFPINITILLMMFGSVVARFSDHLLAGPGVDLYNLMDTPNFELFDLILYLFYAPFSYFFVYFFEKFGIKGFGTLFYIIGCTLGGTMVEWLTKQFHVFNYNGWHLAYSFTVYLIIQTLTLFLYKWCQAPPVDN
ncbi:hypothetical protein [Heyndrickxia camelliae]|uniref:Uncharacterized protein n=1 Tax=Heyndrickxia camelliae TaxID=1707093 RepID=A0A2N3LJA7_9BACI|nr:hypothetical protein [Heyndrickxia camelliae]PKR84667.1 hypothetical protein CWO92_13235 [Heyndrickxia camelliae]